MSERERWIVYPLLFLALGASLRDKLFDMTMSRRIVCQELIIAEDNRTGEEPLPLVKIGAARTTADRRPVGSVYIDGQLDVNGPINANGYALHGIPFGPALRAVLSPADLLRALQRSAAAMQSPPASQGAQPPADGAAEPAGPTAPQPTPPADSDPQPTQ